MSGSIPPVSLLTCGGTIAMATNSDGVRELSDRVIADFEELLPEVAQFPGPNLDSSQACPEDWAAILAAARPLAAQGPLVITHGTDTMAWTAAALAVAGGWSHAVVLTGSATPLDVPGSTAATNLRAAVVASRVLPAGVWACAGNDPHRVDLIQAGYVRKVGTTETLFEDVHGRPSGYVTEGKVVLLATRPLPALPQASTGPVFVETLWPGWVPRSWPEGSTVLLVLYQSMTAPQGVLGAVEANGAAGVRFVGIPASPLDDEGLHYSSAVGLLERGVELFPLLSVELAACALLRHQYCP